MQQVVIALFALTFVFPFSASPQDASPRRGPDFSGTWKMDASRSESAHQDTPIGPVTLVIRQTPVDLTIQTNRSQSGPYAVSTETLACTLDGAETKNTGKDGVVVSAKAHWNESKLVVETERDINGSTVTTMQMFQLDSSGRELTIDKTLTVQHGYQGTEPQRSTGTGRDVFIKAGK